MYQQAYDLVTERILRACKDTDERYDRAVIAAIKKYLKLKGVAHISEFPVNEVYGHAEEICRIVDRTVDEVYEANK